MVTDESEEDEVGRSFPTLKIILTKFSDSWSMK